MKTIFTALLLLICLSSQAQRKELIADETTLTVYQSSFKIVTCNEAILKLMTDTLKPEGYKYTPKLKRSKGGDYVKHVIRYRIKDLGSVRNFFQGL